MTTVTTIVTLVTSILAVFAMIVACMRWMWRQGGSQTKLVGVTEANTGAVTRLNDTFKAYSEKVDGQHLDHEVRITRLESRVPHA